MSSSHVAKTGGTLEREGLRPIQRYTQSDDGYFDKGIVAAAMDAQNKALSH